VGLPTQGMKGLNVSSTFPNPTLPNRAELQPVGVDFARMIPGHQPTVRQGAKKPPRSVRPAPGGNVSAFPAAVADKMPKSALAQLLPLPLRMRGAVRWARAVAADGALVGLNWLFLGALLVPLRMLFPLVRLFRFDMGAPWSLLGIALLHAALITLIGHSDGLYDARKNLELQRKILGKSILIATGVLGLGFVLQGIGWATGLLMSCAGVLHFGALWTWRWQGEKHAQRGDEAGDSRHVLIVGAGETGRRLAAFLEARPGYGRIVYGFVDNDRPLGDGVIGKVGDLARLTRRGFVDELLLAAPHDPELVSQVLREGRRLRLDVDIVPELFGCRVQEGAADRVGDLPLLSLHTEPLPEAALALKRLVDVVGAGGALLSLSPLLIAIAILIRIGSRGPVLYRAQRAGRKGRLFRCYKFRTMVRDADALKDRLRQGNERSGPFFKMADDPRITWLGRFLRRYSLDELPQLWNVLKGEMSLVGPRPHPADDYAGYEIGHLARLDMMPGITGLWQVTARRDPSFQRGLELDREYIRTWSLGSDLRILAKTVMAVAGGSGQ
jgi:exopolysaccharide biosynthesis polyprenyl glycosylphosphotransferase